MVDCDRCCGFAGECNGWINDRGVPRPATEGSRPCEMQDIVEVWCYAPCALAAHMLADDPIGNFIAPALIPVLAWLGVSLIDERTGCLKGYSSKHQMKKTAGKTLSPYSEKRPQWLESLRGSDPNAICRQLSWMAWDATVFEMVNTARGMAPRDEDDAIKVNSMVHELFDRCFFRNQMAAVRRLADDAYSLDDPKRGVWSLVSLLKDMRAHQHGLTRSAILEVEGLFYDYDPLEDRWSECACHHRQTGEWPTDTPDLIRVGLSEIRHGHIDRLAKVEEQARSRDDRIPIDVFSALESRVISTCKDVSMLVSKQIAHSASPQSRAIVNADEVRLTLQQLEDAHRALCEVASFLAIYVLGDAMAGYLATPQYDQFEYLDRPLVEKSDIAKLDSLWLKLHNKYHAWSQWRLEEFEAYKASIPG